ncbi:UNVERIFIED_CONTAM: tc3a [Trichonephila clavipes]
MDDPICYELRVISIATGIPGTIFQQDNARPHVAKPVRDFCSAQHMQLLPWPAYSPDMSPIERMWLIGVSLVILVLQLQKRNFSAHTSNMEFKICLTSCHVV